MRIADVLPLFAGQSVSAIRPRSAIGPYCWSPHARTSTDGEARSGSQSTRASTPSMSDRPGTSSQSSTSSQSTPTAVAPRPVSRRRSHHLGRSRRTRRCGRVQDRAARSTTTQLDSDTAFTTPAGHDVHDRCQSTRFQPRLYRESDDPRHAAGRVRAVERQLADRTAPASKSAPSTGTRVASVTGRGPRC